jgi:hypothetical protein
MKPYLGGKSTRVTSVRPRGTVTWASPCFALHPRRVGKVGKSSIALDNLVLNQSNPLSIIICDKTTPSTRSVNVSDSIIHHVVRHRTHPQALYHRRCYAHRRNRRCCQDGLHRVNLEADTSLSSFVYYNQGLWKVPENACAESVYQAIKAGYRMFDSSSDYANEHESGKGLKRAIDEGLVKREDVFIVTKLWNTFKVSYAARPRGMQGGTGVAYAFGP